jgi:hypothetical protein
VTFSTDSPDALSRSVQPDAPGDAFGTASWGSPLQRDRSVSDPLNGPTVAARYEQEVDGAAGGPAQAALERIVFSSDLADAVRDADLVIEAV